MPRPMHRDRDSARTDFDVEGVRAVAYRANRRAPRPGARDTGRDRRAEIFQSLAPHAHLHT